MIVRESINNQKEWHKEHMRRESWKRAVEGKFDVMIKKMSKGGEEVFLISEQRHDEQAMKNYIRYAEKNNMQLNYKNPEAWGVSGLIFAKDVDFAMTGMPEEMQWWEYKMGVWNIDGTIQLYYDWVTPDMELTEPVTAEELQRLPDHYR